MLKRFAPAFLLLAPLFALAQNKMTPELLWKLGRVTGLGISKDGKYVIFSVNTPDWEANKGSRKSYMIPVAGGTAVETSRPDSLINDKNVSPDGRYSLTNKEVKINKVSGKDFYPELAKSNAQIYDNLNDRHWDTWEDGSFDHVFLSTVGKTGEEKDLMPGEPYDCPQKPFGGDEDYVWQPDGKAVVYVAKKKFGKDYAVSTNTDLYEYDIEKGTTKNLTESNKGYDQSPSFNQQGQLAWLQMRRDGYESDKQDLVASTGMGTVNLTGHRDDIHVEGYRWSDDGRNIFFWAPINGTLQLFEVDYTGATKKLPEIRQITKGDFDINGIIGQSGGKLIVSRTDMNHAAELYSVDIRDGSMTQLTYVNNSIYNSIAQCKTERRWVTTTDNKKMLVWVIYPPDFDPNKKYPTLLYCQGGPQSPLTQFYSFRWNFQLMASQGYIVVAPNRRGMPGHGTKWNEEISKDHGGQAMKDYLSAIDNVSKEKFVDKNRLGCVGASYGGYSVYMLAGIHNNRFKSFIAHDGIFDLRSMYGTTEEMWFVNWDWGGPYWDKKNAAAQRSYNQFNPINYVDKWNTPIMVVQGGKDYRVPIEQGLQAFQAAQLRGIKSKLLYLPDENHWVLSAQNALVWQREFYKWLEETLPPVDKTKSNDKKGF
ncbi:MAG TPA: S9 family peptidase [Chitinophagaceae bacterium]|nr:S9 family peptidase [Chitinophagaceae bacterium]